MSSKAYFTACSVILALVTSSALSVLLGARAALDGALRQRPPSLTAITSGEKADYSGARSLILTPRVRPEIVDAAERDMRLERGLARRPAGVRRAAVSGDQTEALLTGGSSPSAGSGDGQDGSLEEAEAQGLGDPAKAVWEVRRQVAWALSRARAAVRPVPPPKPAPLPRGAPAGQPAAPADPPGEAQEHAPGSELAARGRSPPAEPPGPLPRLASRAEGTAGK